MASPAAPAGPGPFTAVLLAAGMGTRLGALGAGRPKALVPLAGRPLVDHALAFLGALGPERIVVVGGFGIDALRDALAPHASGALTLVDNTRFRAGNLYSVEAGLALTHGAVLIANVDHVFPRSAVPRVRAGLGAQVTAFCEFARTLADDEMKVRCDAARRITAIAKTLPTWDGGYIGLTWVPAARRGEHRAAIAAAHARSGDAAVAEQALQALADAGVPVATASLDGVPWAEVDTPADHAKAAAWIAAGGLER
ncbi:MAG: NTP transferase domain-containing protein [Proteobacteria bacterium]|nr:NTP transferase domain-containing protein [Pseudomonadota bacterium]